MTYAICYNSVMGNTELLAFAAKETLPEDECIYYGTPSEKALEADVIFAGFWTNRSVCDTDMQIFLNTLKNKKVFLFGTAVFGTGERLYREVLRASRTFLDPSNTVVGSYMCSGRVPDELKERYGRSVLSHLDEADRLRLMENIEENEVHPNKKDLDGLRTAVTACYDSLKNEA